MCRALIVEDEKFSRMLLEDILEEYLSEIEIFEAKDGQEAIDMVNEHRPDIIILDMKLPKISGDDVCKYIKGEKELKDTKVLLLTGFVYDKGNEIFNYIDGYITKPYHEEQLVDKIAHLLGGKYKC